MGLLTENKKKVMPQHVEIADNEHYLDQYKHRNNQYCCNRLILENSGKLTKQKSQNKNQMKGGHMNDAIITLLLDTEFLMTKKRSN